MDDGETNRWPVRVHYWRVADRYPDIVLTIEARSIASRTPVSPSRCSHAQTRHLR